MEPSVTVEADRPVRTAVDVEVERSADDHVVDELLLEEISIDGMCGVY